MSHFIISLPPPKEKKKKKKSSAKAGPDPQKKFKHVSSWVGCIWAIDFPPAKAGPKQVSFRAGYTWPLDLSRVGVTWLWPSAAQAEVTLPPDWSTVDVPGAGTPCYPQVETIPGSTFSPPSVRIDCNFPSRKSASNGCKLRGPLQLQKKETNSGYVTNNKFATRTLSFAKIL